MIIDDIALTMHPEVGPRTAIHLVECFGSAERIFAATEQELIERAGIRPAVARSLSRREYHPAADRELQFVSEYGIRVLASDDPLYPERLKECPDYPHVLYVRGTADLNAGKWISFVGTRKMTHYGRRACEKIIGELASLCPDTVVVSGLAYGVDITAHRAAMDAGLTTVGVVAHPLNRIYPAPHTGSARRMIETGGALISEYHSGCRMERSNFVQRNRIIAGMSDGTLIVESPRKGGSLITADMADGYHRTVMAVPGRIDDPFSEGTNHLIRSLKACMVCSGRDVLDALGWKPVTPAYAVSEQELFQPSASFLPSESHYLSEPSQSSESLFAPESFQLSEPLHSSEPFDQPEMDLKLEAKESITSSSSTPRPQTEQERLLSWIGVDDPVSVEELSITTGIPVQKLAVLLLDLELSGEVRSHHGGFYVRSKV